MKFTVKKFVIVCVILIFFAGAAFIGLPYIFSQEARNELARTKVSLKANDYRVTVAMGKVDKIYEFHGKVTSNVKGYYFFWYKSDKGKKYVQVPIAHTLIEEL